MFFLLPILGLGSALAWSSFKQKGGTEGLAARATHGAIQQAKEDLIAEAKSIYSYALSVLQDPAKAKKAAVMAVAKSADKKVAKK